MECEICGKDTILTQITFEGNEVMACQNCRKYGSEQRSQAEHADSYSRYSFAPKQKEISNLVSGFGRVIKTAREKRKLSIHDLAEHIQERESILHKVESEKLKPDEKLIEKLENFFDIQLTESYSDIKLETKTKAEPQTIADLLDKKLGKKGYDY